jgi:hypothetical protein
MVDALENNIAIQIIQTSDDRAGSIAGMTVMANDLEKPFTIEQVRVSYKECWLCSKKDPRRMKIKTTSTVKDTMPEGDKHWRYKTGYGDMVDTSKGIVKQDDYKKQKPINKRVTKGLLELTIAKVKSLLRWIGNKAVALGHKITDLVSGKQPTEIPRKRRKHVTKTMSVGILRPIATVANLTSLSACINTPANASSEIAEANRLIADMQVNKNLSKVGPGGDKTFLNKKRSKVFNSYIAGITSYNVADATTVANNIAAKNHRHHTFNALVMSTTVTSVTLIIRGHRLVPMILIALLVVCYVNSNIEPSWLISLNLLLTSFNMRNFIVNSLISIIELGLAPAKRLAPFRTLVYIIATILSV